MKPSQLKLRPEVEIGSTRLQQLSQYPQLQRRVNSQQFEVSGIHNLIVELRKQAIEQLKQQFINNNNDVNLHQFMWLISNSLILRNAANRKLTLQQEYYQYELQYELVKVFEEIDIDASNSISWEEYIQYITSSSLMELNQTNPNEIRTNQSNKRYKQVYFSHKEKALFRKNQIRQIVEISKLGMIGVLQRKSDSLTFLNANGTALSKPFELLGVDCNKILSFDYSEDDRMFGLLLSSHNVVFVEDGQMQKVHGDNKFTGDEIEIRYLEKHKLWLLICLDNSIQIFSPFKGRGKANENNRNLLKFKPHPSDLLQINELHNPLSIVTTSRNGSLKIWSLSINQLLVEINPCRQEDFSNCKSIKGFQVFNSSLTSYMICWMFSPQISVWLPSSSLTKPYVGKLKGHIGIVQQAKFLSHFPIVVSIDCKNSIRVWDVSKMQCIQTWKLDRVSSMKIKVLKSVPFILFYEKLIQFYSSVKQKDLNQFSKQTKSIEKQKQQKNNVFKKRQHKSIKITQKQSESYEQNEPSKQKGINKALRIKQQNSQLAEIALGSKEKDASQSNQLILEIVYDDYLDCMIILMKQKVAIVAINTGKVLHTADGESKGETFVTMCLKQNRRLFVANNHGQIDCFKTEDCSKIYKLSPFKISSENANSSKLKSQQTEGEQKQKYLSQAIVYEIFKLDFNSYNKVLLIIAESDFQSIVITYDSFSSFQPSKKKQIIFDQKNLCAFAPSQKFNLFFIGSNRPQIVTIWDYHNFIILKTISVSAPIRQLSCESNKYNALIITDLLGMKILQIASIDAKNNNRQLDMNLVHNEFYIKTKKPVKNAQIVHSRNEILKRKAKKNKVTFRENHEQDIQQLSYKKQMDEPTFHQKWELYILAGSVVQIASIQKLIEQLTVCAEPIHNEKANITKQLKCLAVNPFSCPPPRQTIDLTDIVKQNIQNSKRGITSLGKFKSLIYFTNQNGVLQIYKPQSERILARMFMNNCEVIQWEICYNLVNKIVDRLRKAEQISREIYAYKKLQPIDEEHIQKLRICFLLNKYFKEEQMDILRDFLKGEQKKRKYGLGIKEQRIEPQFKFDNNLQIRPFTKIGLQEQFQQKMEKRFRAKSYASEKIKQIQKKYNKAFAFIKNKQTNQAQQKKGDQTLKNTPINSASMKTLSIKKSVKQKYPIKRSSSSVFKVRNTASSINKMYFEHSKQIKNCLAKIGIANNKLKGLKI